ncbi:MAG: aminoglycoside phosphotransferase family protein [Eubacteriales bacterium]
MIGYISKEPVTKGWSGDKKYCIKDLLGNRYLLRFSPKTQFNRKKVEYELMSRAAALGIPMCKPLDFGVSDEGVYSIQSWVDGRDAESVIPFLPETEQYAYGIESGRILSIIHSIPAPESQEDWETRFNRKLDRKIALYVDCPIKYEYGQTFIDFINENRYLLKDRPQVYQHGDYHIGNMMIGSNKRLYIIDFDRSDFGDPWEEFNRIVWCAQKSPLFASGMVNGYFDNNVPEEFWNLLALNICGNTLSSLPWAIPFGQAETETMINQACEVLTWYDNMKNTVPSWYRL